MYVVAANEMSCSNQQKTWSRGICINELVDWRCWINAKYQKNYDAAIVASVAGGMRRGGEEADLGFRSRLPYSVAAALSSLRF